MKRWKLTLECETLTPVAVTTGEKASNMEYVPVVNTAVNRDFYKYDLTVFIDDLVDEIRRKPNIKDEIIKLVMDGQSIKYIYDKFCGSGSSSRKSLDQKRTLFAFHGDSASEFNSQLDGHRSREINEIFIYRGKPYIPGSSLKVTILELFRLAGFNIPDPNISKEITFGNLNVRMLLRDAFVGRDYTKETPLGLVKVIRNRAPIRKSWKKGKKKGTPPIFSEVILPEQKFNIELLLQFSDSGNDSQESFVKYLEDGGKRQKDFLRKLYQYYGLTLPDRFEEINCVFSIGAFTGAVIKKFEIYKVPRRGKVSLSLDDPSTYPSTIPSVKVNNKFYPLGLVSFKVGDLKPISV